MYFVGMCFYMSAMVDDLALDLDALDRSLNESSSTQAARLNIQRDIAKKIQFHNEIVKYVASSVFL